MILITIRIEMRPNPLKELRQTLSALQPRMRKEKGFLSSQIFKDLEKQNVICIVQEWETQDDLVAYLSSENHKVLLGAIRLLSESPQFKISAFNLNNKVAF